MKKTYVTFGRSHIHRVNNKVFDRDCVAVINCVDERQGRQMAHKFFGVKFFTTYFDDKFSPEIMKFFPRGLINVDGGYEP